MEELKNSSHIRVLDSDLDFFLADITYDPAEGLRHNESGYEPWEPNDVDRFLRERCLLREDRPTAGTMVTEHVEVFDEWRRLIQEGKLRAPFEVVHIDAHADLGLGAASYVFLMTEWLGREPNNRIDPPRGGQHHMTSTDYLAFAVACRWISTLTYVYHPKGRGDDVITPIMKNHDVDSDVIQMQFAGPGVAPSRLLEARYAPVSIEPEVPFYRTDGTDYFAARPFDFVFLAQSPEYTPASADLLIPHITKFIEDH